MKSFFISLILPLFCYTPLLNAMSKVSLQLNRKNSFEFAGYYMAKEKGFYRDSGIDVNILEYKESNIVNDVIKGKVTFGIDDSSLILEKAHNKPVVALSAIFQHSPASLMTLESSHITKIEQLKNKKIMATDTFFKNPYIKLLFHSKNIDLESLKAPTSSNSIKSLIDKKIDALLVYRTDQPYDMQENRVKYNLITPANYGVDFYNDILFTSKIELQTNPKMVKSFVNATLDGWRYAYAHVDETIKIILKKHNTQHLSYEKLAFEANAMKNLLEIDTNNFGNINKHKIDNIINIYRISGEHINKNIVNSFIYDFSNGNLKLSQEESAYLKKKKLIKMCVNPKWAKFEMVEEGRLAGIISEYFNIIKKKVDAPIEIVETDDWNQTLEYVKNKKCDILSLALRTKSKERHMDFTESYFSIPLVIVTKLDKVFIENINSIKSQKFGITRDAPFIELVKQDYPNVDFVEVSSVKEGLKMVSSGELYGFIDTLLTAGQEVQKYYYGGLKISGRLEDELDLSIAVRIDEPHLLGVFNKALSKISLEQKQEILNHWISVKYDKGFDYSIFIYIAIFIVILVLFYIQREKTLKKYNLILEEKNKELKVLASTDVLTEIMSRRSFLEVANQILLIAKRDKTPTSFLMLDIDHFKKINDAHGHSVGDEVLKHFTKTTLRALRESDIFGRLGGEEFGILLNKTDKDIAYALAQRVRKAVKENHLVLGNQKISYTVSVGVSASSEVNEFDNIDKLIDNADNALYISKNSGRDRVT